MEEERRLEKLLEEARALANQQNWESLRLLLSGAHPADIADLLDRLEPEEGLRIFDKLEPDVAREVLDEAGPDATRTLLEGLHPDTLSQLLQEMPAGDAAELLEDLPPQDVRELLELMESEEAREVRAALAYPDDSAGRIMSEKFVRVRRRWTVEETLEYLRSMDPETDLFYYLYAVDEDDHLVGVLPLRALLTGRQDQTIRDLIEPNVISVSVTTDREEVARVVAKYDFLAVPVVDELRRLVGIVSVDDVIDILAEESTEDIQLLGGSQSLDQPYLTTTLTQMVRKRFAWLLVLFVAETFTGSVLRHFEGELTQVVALAFFVPLLIGTGGNSGSQAVTIVVRALSIGEIGLRDVWRVLRRLGLLMAAAGLVRARTWGSPGDLAVTVGVSLFVIVIWANLVGSVIPLAATRAGLDPAVLSAPLITTLVDATGLFIYFTVAALVLRL